MKILLVSPQSEVWTSRKHIPLGLGYLAAVLRQSHHDVQIYDAVVEDETLGTVLDRERYDIVGISSTTPLIYEAWKDAAEARRHGAVTILGGPHLTLMPEESLKRDEVDIVVRGEAEDTILEVINALEATQDWDVEKGKKWRGFDPSVWSKVKSISFRDPQGNIIHNADQPLNGDIDRIPFPAHDMFKIERYTNLQPLTDGLDPNARAYTILTSRGCPYQCIYCSKAITGRTWRPRSPENVVKEWRWLVRDLHATEIGVTDDVMTLDIDRAKEICRLLIAEGLNTVPWITIHGIKAGNTDAELLGLMHRAGCKRVGFGVESGNQRVLDSIKKQQTLDEVREAFRNARAAGLETMGFFIFGMPGETEETMEDTIRFALELEPDLANFMIATPYPGTEMYEMIQKHGKLFTDNWTDFAIHDECALYEMDGLSREVVERKWHEAYRRFYLRPSRIWQRVTSPDTWRRLPEHFGNFLRFFAPVKRET